MALHFFNLSIAQNFFKKNAFVGHVLVDNPQSVLAGGQNEGLAELRQRPERGQVVEVEEACSASTRAAAWPAWLELAEKGSGSQFSEPAMPEGLKRAAAASPQARVSMALAALSLKGRLPGTGEGWRGVSWKGSASDWAVSRAWGSESGGRR